MSEVRHDWLSDRWVIFAPSRSERPDEFEVFEQASRLSGLELGKSNSRSSFCCPFCIGKEEETPNPVLVLDDEGVHESNPYPSRTNQAPLPWRVRVVPNKFPAVIPVDPGFDLTQIEDLSNSLHTDPSFDDRVESVLYHRRPLLGAHEVIIESPEHVASITQLSASHLESVFLAFQMRLSHWRRHPSLQYAVIFKNCGAEAGASLVHTHSQLIATSFVPPEIARISHRMEQFRQEFSNCYGCTVVAEEVSKQERVIRQTNSFVAFCPFASSLPYSFVIAPIEHNPRFEDLERDALNEFTQLVFELLRALETLFPHNAYNFVLHTSPFHEHWNRAFHWRLEVIPRLTKLAGFEWGSNCFINPVLPEVAALQLRQTLTKSYAPAS